MRLLIDECLSAALVPMARERGHSADHVVHLGLGGRQDWNLIPVIEDGDYVFVTNNRCDFLRLYARQALHNGLIVIVPNVSREPQRMLFTKVLDEIATRSDLVNLVLEIDAEGTITVFPLPIPE